MDTQHLSTAERLALLKLARASAPMQAPATLSPIEPVDRSGPLPLSFAQQRLWFIEQLGNQGSAYHLRSPVRLRGELDRAALARALDALVARHEALRTVFAQVDGVPRQRIAPAGESRFHLVEHDLAGEADPQAELARLTAEEGRARFDLERGPLIRGRLIRVAADDHVLLLTMHHIVSDDWSMGVLTRELSALYAAFRRGEPDPLPALPVQYADYAVWQRRRVEGEVLQAQAEYWTRTLAGAPELLELPADHPRPALQEHAGARFGVVLDEALTAGLRALSQRHGTTLFMTLLAGWAAVLGRLAGQDDVVVGTPMAGRGRREIEELIGFFVNTLALRVDLSGSPTVAGLLRRVRERVLEAQKHQDIPFEQVVELAAPARSLSHTPLFQALFAWQNAPRGDGLSLPGLELGGVGPASQEVLSKFDLSLSLREAGDRITGNVTYATALFERETVERWVGYLRRVLEEMAADESRPVERLALMPAGERARLVEEWNRTDAEYPADSCVHERFEARARRAPDAVAVVHEGEHLTYAELNRRANRLAHHLRGLGVGPDVRVGICVERGPAMLAGVLAVLKAGGAFVPFDPAFPAERLRFMLEDSAPSVVLTQASLAGLLEGEGVPLLLLDRDLPDAAVPETDPERAGLLPEHLAYVIYTSGSTGRPKGVMVPHRGVVNSVEAFREVYRIVPGARVLFFAPLYFDASVLDIFPTFAAGATLVVGSEAELVPGDALIGMLRRHQVTHAKFTPSVLAALPDADLPELGAVMSGGDACPAEVVERWGQGRRFYNGCGATEVSVRTMVIETADFTRPPPIGRAVANVRLYVVDELLQPVPVGVAGEMCVGGIQVTRGYQNRPELTADRFVADPFGTGPGARMYRTGDRVRWLPDGNIEFLGRTDFQVKVRGFRIELGEIEARLAEHPGVREAVVLARGDGPGGGGEKRLVAYYVGEGGAVGAESLRAHLGERLPEYMVPAAYVRLEHFPLTPAGKLDRAALPAPEGDAYVVREYEEPVGETEQALAEIWAEVLGAERVGRRDDFFDLGGHSLLAVQVISRVRQVLEAEVELGTLFTRPVLADFARELETAARAALPPIEPAAREGRVPLSFAQQRLWFLEQLGTLGSAYHVSKRQRLRGELDRGALARALDAIVARHESLRTVFAQTDGVPEQRIAPADAGFPLREHDLEGHADAKAELGRLVAEEAHAPFDLARGPLIRGRLVRLAADDHLLLVTMHHIVSDGWSMGVLTRELGALYAAFRGGAPDPLPPLPVQYADYAIWQRRWVDGAVLQAQADYWKATLAGAPELLELPTDRPRPAQMELAGAQLRVVLDEELTAALKALSRRRGTTLFMTLLAGWAVVLSRLSGQDDVVVGTPMAGRGRREIEGLIGFFVNTLALRLDLSGAPTAAAVLARVKERTLAAQHHQDIPFEQVVELVDPARSLAHSPLFQVLFAWQNTPRAGGLSLPGLRPAGGAGASPAEAPVGAPADAPAEAQATRDLALSLHEADGRIAGNVLYARALFDRETVERHVGYLRRVLHELAADESRPVERIPLMPESERARVLEEWNQTAAAYPAGSCIHELFEEQAERRPHAVAVVFGDERWSYGELNARANRLAHRLRSLGVGPDARVAICVERSPAMMVGLLGVLKAGGAYVPLDPGYPAERLEHMLADGAPAAVLTQRSLRDRFAGAAVPVLELDAAHPEWAGRPATDPERGGLTPAHLAYVIYTSGSTGVPKGVAVHHRAVVNQLAWAQRTWALGAHEAVLQRISFSFDASVRELFWALTAGACLVLARPAGQNDPAELVETIAREGVGAVHMVPSLLRALLEEPGFGACAGLARVMCGGEVLPPAVARRFHERMPAATLFHMYGPTETTVAATGGSHRPEELDGRLPLGRPVANTRVYVLDERGEPVPVGVAGELCIGGAQVARGYLGRPELTAERFVADPFGGVAGARLYRTGDLARRLPDGRLDFLGRIDHQVKVRGFRVELGEIEARLAGHPAVREAVVLVREDAPGEQRLVAYVVGGEAATAEALRAHLAEALPEYMVPAAYVRLEQWPLTPNGKLDRAALLAPEGGAFAARAYQAPETDTEQALAEIWAEVLRVERVGRLDHFFELGGHSLLAVQVISRVRQVLEVEVALGELFTRPVLADFARELETAARSELPPIEPAPRDGRVPLSFAQQRLWFLEQLGGLGSTYHMRTRRRLRGELDRAALRRALDALVARHEALRTVFAQVDGVPEQRIAPAESGFHLVEHDLEGAADPQAELDRVALEEARAPLDLERGPLIRGRLARLAADDHVLLVTMHHIVSDDWSMGVLNRELSALYEAFRRGAPDPLPPLPVQYPDYAVWQRRWVDGLVLQEQAEYWTRTLGGAPELLELPTDHPRPALPDHAGAQVGMVLGGELTAGLKALSRRHGTTLFMTVMAGWAVMLGRLSGQDDVVVGSPTAGRGRREIEGLIGFFVNTLALRVDLSGSPTVAEVLARVKRRALEAQHHQDIPFEQVIELVAPARSLSHSPLVQATFHWQNAPRGSLELPGLTLARVQARDERGTAKQDLGLSLGEANGRIGGSVLYATALFRRETVERWVGYLRRVLEEMVADDGQRVERLGLIPADERARVLDEWNRTAVEYPSRSCIHELVEAQVERTPDAAAVVQENAALSYAELNRRANRLAHHLGGLGVGPDARVAICVERGLEMVVGMLGVLKAGGAYVPLDPGYPPERLRYMLQDSAPRVVLTQSSLIADGGLFDAVGAPVLALDAAEWSDAPGTNPARGGLDPSHGAYLIYTSGSTGQPKGVLVPHRGLCNFIHGDFPGFGVGPGDRVLQFSSFSFDACAFETFRTLTRGASLHLAGRGKVLSGDTLSQTAARHGITHAVLPPAVLDAMPAGEALPSIRTMVVAGDAVREPLVRRWAPDRWLINAYGPTEATVCASLGRCLADEPGDPTIGRPIWNARIYILDAAGEPVPTGVAGELFIGGAGVARGYLNRPELTAERFVADPFGGEPGARMYRTGDRVRWLADGRLDFVGRVDHQVKLRGYRVELGEIEARLTDHPAVREAVVLVREDTPGDRRLVAYVVADEAAGAEVLRAYLGETLPEYMVPAAYLRLDELPLTPNGKLDRKALPAPEGDAWARRAYEAPVGETEEMLAQVWSEVLGVERVGRHDDFFELGGHSLLAVQVISQLAVDIDLGELFTKPVLADFARELEKVGRAELPPIEPAPREGRVPLSFAQQRLWFLEQLGGLGSTYHVPVRLRLRGALDRGALLRALDGMVARHETLRTTFPTVDGVPEQRIAPAGESRFPLDEDDLGGEGEGALERLMARETGARFDLERGPLIRGRLVRVAADDHVLLVTMHHIVSDGWSMGVFTRELSALYAAYREGREAGLPELPVQYADFALWQRRWVEGEVLREQADYWRHTLAGAPELLELPADRPRPARMDHAGAQMGVVLDEALTAGLKALGRRHGTTLFMTLLAGWATVLGRLSGQDDVVVGTPTAGRGRREIDELIGFFINTLALRVDFSGAPTVGELLARVKQRALDGQHHQDIPFEQVVELVDPARSMAHAPVFQVMFTWQNAPRGGLSLPGLAVESVRARSTQVHAKFDLSLSLQEAGDRIVGAVTYATALFDRDTIERHVGYLRRVLEAMAAGEGLPVERLPLLPAGERARVVEEWNRTDAEYPAESCVHELFQAQAARTPDAPAVVGEGEALAYAELNARANRLARHLRSLGVGPDTRVAVCLERGPEMVAALLAVLKAGGAYVPLDPGHPAERLAYMLGDSAPAAVLTQRALRERVEGAGVPVLEVDAAAPAWADQPATDPERGALTPAHAAYVIYTSGSTGRPKGVVVPHRGVVNLLASIQDTVGMEPGDRLLAVTTYAFDISVLELFLPLLHGARTIVLPRERAADPAALAEALRAHAPTVMQATPATWRMLLDAGWEGAPGLRALCGGEALPAALASALRGRVGALWNVYGPTETTIWSTAHAVPGDAPGAAGGQVPVGRPLANTRVYLLDPAGEPVPVGVAGELCIGGAGVVRGYLGRPEQTAERFVADPFAAGPGARMYRTGDRARWLADGTVEFLGRTDFQVKVRGFRIEPGEIEARLREHPGVRDAVVLAREDVPGDVRLVAYLVGDADTEAVRAHLAAALPEYMVPAAYLWLEQLPLTPNGKLDRKALPAPGGGAYAARAYQAPATETEQALAEIWAEVLRVERVGRHDHFFELGGHSLLAVQVISRVRQVLSAQVSLGDLFTRPTLAGFARGLETAAPSQLPPIEPAPREGRVPLSFAQQRLWFLEQLGGLGSAYHIRKRLPLRGELDRAALGRALDAIVARHESLRTTFAQVGGVPEQRIAPADTGFHLVEHDLGGEADRRAALDRLAADEAEAPFDLERGPLVRGRLVRLAADHHVLLVTMHHIVSDGWSLEVFTRELNALYGAFSRGEPDPLPALPVQYPDYAAWQRRWLAGEVLQEQAEYWTRTLAGAPELLELPTDHPRPAEMDHAGALLGVELGDELTAGLKALGRRHGTTLFMTLLAGWATVLGRLAGQDDVVIGTPTANRGRAEIEGLIGFFVNTLALRVDLSGAPAVAELLARVKERALDAQHHQDIPFEQVVERVDPARSLAHTPLFQVMFAWQSASAAGAEQAGPTPVPAVRPERTMAQFDLSLTLSERGGRVGGIIEYRTALFERETVERYAGYLRRVLEEMVADQRRSVARLALMPPAERAQVVDGWNDTDLPCPDDRCVHELFERQAEETPGATALVFEGGELTYAQLNARANRLAHHLRGLGVGPDARVAVCAERSPELVAALLAVLKAGGAYVPLDPAYPEERLRELMEDSAPVAVLAHGSLGGRFAGAGVPVIEVDAAAPAWAAGPETDPGRGALQPGHLAYVIYTSGSTGRPKGVMVPHRAVHRQLAAIQAGFGLRASDRFLQFASFAFDASVEEIFGALATGAALVLRTDAWLEGAQAFWSRCAESGVTVADLPTRFWQLLLDDPSAAIPPCLRLLAIGGEAVDPAALRAWFARDGYRPPLLNSYGPTETTVNATLREVSGDPATWRSIGRPVANTRAYLLDRAGEPVPVGVVGELFIGGGQVARGYLDRPALTAERFVPDPFSRDSGARLYRTGDLGRWLADGSIEYLGRNDFQVKIRGFRIELGEVEARLAEHPAVRDAVVLAREDVPGERRLVAYYTAQAPAEAEALRAHLAGRLPEHMLPAAFVRLDALPLTAGRKVDRRALPAPEGDAYATRGYEAPAGETERAVAAVWAEVLGVERVGRRDHFFELGGYSLLAVQVISRVRQALSVQVALGDLFTRPVLADFARELETAPRAELPPIEPAGREGRLPLSFAQQRLWFLEQMEELGSTYHISHRMRLRGEMDRDALVRTLDRIVARHEVLRTVFVEVDGVAEQRIAPAEAGGLYLVEHDLGGRPDAMAELRRLVAAEARAPFDLARGPLIRGRLVRLAADDHVLLLTMHHIISDGWSMGVFTRELGALYAAFHAGEPDPLPPLPIQYADYAVWQRRWVDGELLQAQADYWKATLAGAPELLELRTDHPRPARQDFAGASVGMEVGTELTAGLKALSQRHGTTLFMTLLAAWSAVLGRLAGQDDVVIGTSAAGRGRQELEGLIGFFVNTLALRVDLSGSPSVGELLARVRRRALEAQHHQDIPFEQVVELVRPERSRAHSPLFQVMFSWQNTPREALELPGLGAGVPEAAAAAAAETPPPPTVQASRTARYDLSLTLLEVDGRIAGGIEYATSLFERRTVERFLGYLHNVLEAMVRDDAAAVDELPMIAEAERRQVLGEWDDEVEISL